jgi:hyperosmotically inducible protein
MQNLKYFMLATCLTASAAVTCLTGCSTWHQKTSERSEGRMVDDHKIAAQVRSDLKSEPVYKFNDVSVKTFDGIVQLSGFVNSDEQKRRAEELARNIPGVVEVQNAISLKPTGNSYSPTGRNFNNNNGANGNYNQNQTRPNDTIRTTPSPNPSNP